MTTQQFSQPEPFDPGVPPGMPPMRPMPVQRGPRSRIVPVLAGLLVLVVGFGGGFAVARATGGTASANGGGGGDGNGFPGNGEGFGPNASGRPQRNSFGGGASGTIGTVSADQMTITTQAGGQRIVLLTPTTTVTEVTAANKTVADLAAGATVTVVGTSNPDGSVTATRVIIGEAGIFGGRGFGGGLGGNGGPGGPAAPSTAP